MSDDPSSLRALLDASNASDEDDVERTDTEDDSLNNALTTVESGAVSVEPPLQTLYDCVRKCPKSIPQAAKQWVARYKADRSSGFAELMSLILEGGGVSVSIPPESMQLDELPSFIQSLPDDLPPRCGEEPFRVKKGQRTFRLHYGRLWGEIVRETIATALLLDDRLRDGLTTTLIELSKYALRCAQSARALFRSPVSIGWISALNANNDGLATVLRQRELEERKRPNKATGRKIQQLTQTVEVYRKRGQELESRLERLFSGVFAQRYRDVCERVRGVTTEAISQWCLLLPQLYLFDDYLKYLAWSLCDKAAEVRLAAVTGFLKLCEKNLESMPLSECIVRFRKRLCEMVYDVDDGVAVQCTKLLAALVAKREIPIRDIHHVYEILTDEASTLRHAVADLVCALLKGNAKEKAASKFVSRSEAELVFTGLINILCSIAQKQGSGADEVECWTEDCEYDGSFRLSSDFIKRLMTPLFDKLEVLKDWGLILSQLNVEMDKGDTADSRFNLVIQLLDVSIQLLTEEQQRVQRGRGRKQDANEKARQDMTNTLMDHLASWISDFQMEHTKILCFVRMVRGLKLELFVLRSASRQFEAILENITEVLFKRHEAPIIEECIHALIYLSTQAPEEHRSIGRDCVKGVGMKLLETVLQTASNLEALLKTPEGQNELTAFSATLERVKYLLASDGREAIDCGELQACLSEMICVAQGSVQLAEHMGVSLSQCQFLLFLQYLTDKKMDSTDALSHQRELLGLMKVILAETANEAVRWEATGLMVDLYLLFGCASSEEHCTKIDPQEWMFSALWPLLQNRINTAIASEPDSQQEQQLCEDVGVLGKLVLCGDLSAEYLKRLGGRLMQLLISPCTALVDVVKSVIRRLRKIRPQTLSDCFLRAMMDCYDASGGSELESFLALSQKISQSYVVFNNAEAKQHVHQFVSNAIGAAMEAAEPKLRFISEGLSSFTSKLSGKSCEKLKEKLLNLRAHREISNEDWKPMEPYVLSLAERARRLRMERVERDHERESHPETPHVEPGCDESVPQELSEAEEIQKDESEAALMASPGFSLNSQGISESHVFDMAGWNYSLSDPVGTSDAPDPPEAASVTRPVKMSYARRVEEDEELFSPRKKPRRGTEKADG